ncbi:hypothetical protein EBR96_00730 [bacterium]|nr:hypothetical protein [bacterium]
MQGVTLSAALPAAWRGSQGLLAAVQSPEGLASRTGVVAGLASVGQVAPYAIPLVIKQLKSSFPEVDGRFWRGFEMVLSLIARLAPRVSVVENGLYPVVRFVEPNGRSWIVSRTETRSTVDLGEINPANLKERLSSTAEKAPRPDAGERRPRWTKEPILFGDESGDQLALHLDTPFSRIRHHRSMILRQNGTVQFEHQFSGTGPDGGMQSLMVKQVDSRHFEVESGLAQTTLHIRDGKIFVVNPDERISMSDLAPFLRNIAVRCTDGVLRQDVSVVHELPSESVPPAKSTPGRTFAEPVEAPIPEYRPSGGSVLRHRDKSGRWTTVSRTGKTVAGAVVGFALSGGNPAGAVFGAFLFGTIKPVRADAPLSNIAPDPAIANVTIPAGTTYYREFSSSGPANAVWTSQLESGADSFEVLNPPIYMSVLNTIATPSGSPALIKSISAGNSVASTGSVLMFVQDNAVIKTVTQYVDPVTGAIDSVAGSNLLETAKNGDVVFAKGQYLFFLDSQGNSLQKLDLLVPGTTNPTLFAICKHGSGLAVVDNKRFVTTLKIGASGKWEKVSQRLVLANGLGITSDGISKVFVVSGSAIYRLDDGISDPIELTRIGGTKIAYSENNGIKRLFVSDSTNNVYSFRVKSDGTLSTQDEAGNGIRAVPNAVSVTDILPYCGRLYILFGSTSQIVVRDNGLAYIGDFTVTKIVGGTFMPGDELQIAGGVNGIIRVNGLGVSPTTKSPPVIVRSKAGLPAGEHSYSLRTTATVAGVPETSETDVTITGNITPEIDSAQLMLGPVQAQSLQTINGQLVLVALPNQSLQLILPIAAITRNPDAVVTPANLSVSGPFPLVITCDGTNCYFSSDRIPADARDVKIPASQRVFTITYSDGVELDDGTTGTATLNIRTSIAHVPPVLTAPLPSAGAPFTCRIGDRPSTGCAVPLGIDMIGGTISLAQGTPDWLSIAKVGEVWQLQGNPVLGSQTLGPISAVLVIQDDQGITILRDSAGQPVTPIVFATIPPQPLVNGVTEAASQMPAARVGPGNNAGQFYAWPVQNIESPDGFPIQTQFDAGPISPYMSVGSSPNILLYKDFPLSLVETNQMVTITSRATYNGQPVPGLDPVVVTRLIKIIPPVSPEFVSKVVTIGSNLRPGQLFTLRLPGIAPATGGQNIRYQISVSGMAGELPDGMQFDSTTGYIEYTPKGEIIPVGQKSQELTITATLVDEFQATRPSEAALTFGITIENGLDASVTSISGAEAGTIHGLGVRFNSTVSGPVSAEFRVEKANMLVGGGQTLVLRGDNVTHLNELTASGLVTIGPDEEGPTGAISVDVNDGVNQKVVRTIPVAITQVPEPASTRDLSNGAVTEGRSFSGTISNGLSGIFSHDSDSRSKQGMLTWSAIADNGNVLISGEAVQTAVGEWEYTVPPMSDSYKLKFDFTDARGFVAPPFYQPVTVQKIPKKDPVYIQYKDAIAWGSVAGTLASLLLATCACYGRRNGKIVMTAQQVNTLVRRMQLSRLDLTNLYELQSIFNQVIQLVEDMQEFIPAKDAAALIRRTDTLLRVTTPVLEADTNIRTIDLVNKLFVIMITFLNEQAATSLPDAVGMSTPNSRINLDSVFPNLIPKIASLSDRLKKKIVERSPGSSTPALLLLSQTIYQLSMVWVMGQSFVGSRLAPKITREDRESILSALGGALANIRAYRNPTYSPARNPDMNWVIGGIYNSIAMVRAIWDSDSRLALVDSFGKIGKGKVLTSFLYYTRDSPVPEVVRALIEMSIGVNRLSTRPEEFEAFNSECLRMVLSTGHFGLAVHYLAFLRAVSRYNSVSFSQATAVTGALAKAQLRKLTKFDGTLSGIFWGRKNWVSCTSLPCVEDVRIRAIHTLANRLAANGVPGDEDALRMLIKTMFPLEVVRLLNGDGPRLATGCLVAIENRWFDLNYGRKYSRLIAISSAPAKSFSVPNPLAQSRRGPDVELVPMPFASPDVRSGGLPGSLAGDEELRTNEV